MEVAAEELVKEEEKPVAPSNALTTEDLEKISSSVLPAADEWTAQEDWWVERIIKVTDGGEKAAEPAKLIEEDQITKE